MFYYETQQDEEEETITPLELTTSHYDCGSTSDNYGLGGLDPTKTSVKYGVHVKKH